MILLLMRVSIRVEFKIQPSSNRQLNIALGYFTFFYDTVRQYRCNPTMEEIEHSIIRGSESNS